LKFGQLTLGKIIEIVATKCQILRLKCTKFNFGWGSAPDPAGGAYSAPQDPLAGFKGPTSKGRGGDGMDRERDGVGETTGRGGGREGERRGKGGRGRKGEATPSRPPNPYFWIRPCHDIIQRQITRKWYNIELYLQWQINRKSHMVYRAAPFSMTLNDP